MKMIYPESLAPASTCPSIEDCNDVEFTYSRSGRNYSLPVHDLKSFNIAMDKVFSELTEEENKILANPYAKK